MQVYLKNAKEIIKKNKSIFVITTLMISLTSILMIIALMVSILGHQFSQYLNNSQKISVLFDSTTPAIEIQNFIDKYKNDPAVKKIYKKPPEEVMKEFLPNDYNIPPDDLIKIVRIDLNPNIDSHDLVQSIMKDQASSENIIEIIYLPNLYQKLHTISLWGNIFSGLILFIFIIISVILIYVTLKLGLEKLKKELQVMKDIGAPKEFIEKPLIITTFLMMFAGEIIGLILIGIFTIILTTIIKELELTTFIQVLLQSLHAEKIFTFQFLILVIVAQIVLYSIVSIAFIKRLVNKSYKP